MLVCALLNSYRHTGLVVPFSSVDDVLHYLLYYLNTQLGNKIILMHCDLPCLF